MLCGRPYRKTEPVKDTLGQEETFYVTMFAGFLLCIQHSSCCCRMVEANRRQEVQYYWYSIYDSSVGKESTYNVGDPGSIPGSGRSPGEGKGYPLQYSGLENSMDCIVHGVAKSWTWPSNSAHMHVPGFSVYEVFLLREPTYYYNFLMRQAMLVTPSFDTWGNWDSKWCSSGACLLNCSVMYNSWRSQEL